MSPRPGRPVLSSAPPVSAHSSGMVMCALGFTLSLASGTDADGLALSPIPESRHGAFEELTLFDTGTP
jgi:hypothetical protein